MPYKASNPVEASPQGSKKSANVEGESHPRPGSSKLSKDQVYYLRNAEKCKARSREHYHTVGKYQRQARAAAKKAAKRQDIEAQAGEDVRSEVETTADAVPDAVERWLTSAWVQRQGIGPNTSPSPLSVDRSQTDRLRGLIAEVDTWLSKWGGHRDQWLAMSDIYQNDYRAMTDVRYHAEDGQILLRRLAPSIDELERLAPLGWPRDSSMKRLCVDGRAAMKMVQDGLRRLGWTND
ncbi:hypothetical protein FISHEDRAFT_77321 [Fistulina hepatica ATCC 64428]|uniref:Uncharacterized protein n=1 Tax=Fistulina hepatica ATCC 64428 TaxID=1128425 RepID=A0A0D7A2U2_9AGAR|nr:hypothetical protein FISHEDRAFT_77321 [Fistulina hepatica ATCC 64428]